MKKKKHLMPREAAQILGIRLDSLYSLIWAGKIVAKKTEGRWLIPSGEVEARKEAQTSRAGE